MKELMEKTWSLYEAEKAAGNAEAADLIGDVYTTLDILDMGMDVEANRDYMEKVYYGMCKLSFRVEGFNLNGELHSVRAMLEDELVKAGILEGDEEPEDEEEEEEVLDYTNDSAHWDEWAADQRYDMYRDLALMGYEY